MRPALIIRGFLASPSDVQEERNEALKVITEWNAVNSLDREAIIEIVRTETHSSLEQGEHPQQIINKQLLDQCDFLIAVFWSKLGTPTNSEKSGTIHEIKEFARLKGAENVKLFFSERDVPYSIDTGDLRALKEFRKEMQTEGLYRSFSNIEQFGRELRNQLDLVMNKLLKSDEAKQLWSRRALLTEKDKIELDREKMRLEADRIQTEQIIGQRLPRG
jgi:hypothetical protein